MKTFLELSLNESEKIVLKSESDIQELFFCDDIEIDILVEQEYRLAFDCLQYTLRSLVGHLSLVIDNKLQLHSSIKHDLGYLWNEECTGKSELKFVLEKSGDSKQWVGERYMLLSSPGIFNPRLTTWLYNNQVGEIILEITPSYR